LRVSLQLISPLTPQFHTSNPQHLNFSFSISLLFFQQFTSNSPRASIHQFSGFFNTLHYRQIFISAPEELKHTFVSNFNFDFFIEKLELKQGFTSASFFYPQDFNSIFS